MPAETHQHGDRVDAPAVLELIWALVSDADDAEVPDPRASLSQLDLDDELAMLRLWEAVTDELAERTVAVADLADLLAATSLGELADAMADAL